MPVEMRELNIRINVNQQAGGAGPQNVSGNDATKEDSEALVKECVEQVLSILDNKKER